MDNLELSTLRALAVIVLLLRPAWSDGRTLSFSWKPFMLSWLVYGGFEAVLGMSTVQVFDALLTVFSAIILIILLHALPGRLGEGDVLVLICLLLILPWLHFLYILILSCFLGVCYHLLGKLRWGRAWDGMLPFVSLMWFAVLIVEGTKWLKSALV